MAAEDVYLSSAETKKAVVGHVSTKVTKVWAQVSSRWIPRVPLHVRSRFWDM